MGLSSSVHWISWYITFSCYLVPAMAVYTILCCASLTKNGSVISKTDASLLFVFFLCYIVAVISFIFMVSTFVQKGKLLVFISFHNTLLYLLLTNYKYLLAVIIKNSIHIYPWLTHFIFPGLNHLDSSGGPEFKSYVLSFLEVL